MKKIEQRKIPMKQQLRDKALEAFRLWQRTENKVKY